MGEEPIISMVRFLCLIFSLIFSQKNSHQTNWDKKAEQFQKSDLALGKRDISVPVMIQKLKFFKISQIVCVNFSHRQEGENN